MTDRIQIALKDRTQSERLRDLLLRTCSLGAQAVDAPNFAEDGVIVLDVSRIPSGDGRIERPERLVAVSPKREDCLERAWNAGIRIVVYDTEPMTSIVLAAMSALLAARPHLAGRSGHAAAASR